MLQSSNVGGEFEDVTGLRRTHRDSVDKLTASFDGPNHDMQGTALNLGRC
jgi:hypothetical protein